MVTTRITTTRIMTTVDLFPRGMVVECAGERMRVQSVRGTTVTVRYCHANRWLEWLHSWFESWILWPLDDLGNMALGELFGR